jgi:AraC-like DNA-binding protein
MYDIEPIKRYIIMLKERFGLSVSVHAKNRSVTLLTRELSQFNIHAFSYCSLLKTSEGASKNCIINQRKALKRSERGDYCGVCYAGVFEYVFPIEGNEGVIGMVSVSGYRSPEGRKGIDYINETYGIPKDLLEKAYSTLKDPPSHPDEINTLLKPLIQMLKLAFILGDFKEKELPEPLRCALEYIRKNKNESITTNDVCSAVGLCRATITSLFKSHLKMTVKDYLTKLRIQDSKELLSHSELSVTEIAYTVGYGDSNHFSVLFKKQTGCTPLEYRKNYQKSAKKELLK